MNGRDITAQLTAIIDNPLYFIYRVLFNDGFEDDFSVLENGFIEGTKDGAKGYTFAIKDDLHALHGFNENRKIIYSDSDRFFDICSFSHLKIKAFTGVRVSERIKPSVNIYSVFYDFFDFTVSLGKAF